ncbi:unnamed protein product [Ranitomeya imitator]|uniref:Uncharacterized protein n=1 Tax=Ranitomeya imitator TaxID=111125 RepID=A0ABN9LF76_9NEOB|nr:unnamed protein product [Ranitomeya imitator]
MALKPPEYYKSQHARSSTVSRSSHYSAHCPDPGTILTVIQSPCCQTPLAGCAHASIFSSACISSHSAGIAGPRLLFNVYCSEPKSRSRSQDAPSDGAGARRHQPQLHWTKSAEETTGRISRPQ